MSALAARGVNDWLSEGMKWHGHLEDDPALLELAAGGEVRGRPVSEWLDHDLVLAGTRQPGQRPACGGVGHALEVASNDHAASIRNVG